MMGKSEALPTIWEIPDHLWEQIHPVILDMDPPKGTGRKRADPRRMLDGIVFRMRSGCQWNRLPRQLGDDSTIHGTSSAGWSWECWRRIALWAKPILGGAIGRNPTDRGKAGSKKSILVDAEGGPLSVAVAGANVHDTKLLRPTLESIVVERPEGFQNLCWDKGYDNPTGPGTVAAFGYCPPIRRIGEEKLDRWGEQTFPSRRWVVERTLSWLSKCRAILVRYEKKASNYLGMIQLACALLWYRRQHRLLF